MTRTRFPWRYSAGAAARRVARRVGRRGTFLLFLGLLDVVYGTGLMGNLASSTPAYQAATRVLPLCVWAVVWTAVGVCCAVSAFLSRDQAAFGLATCLKVSWGGLGLLGWLNGDAPRGYVTAVVWLAFAGVVSVVSGWMENWATDRAPGPRP